jgi:hypothetical protein
MKALFLVICLLVGWVVASGKGKHQWVRLIDVFLYGPLLLLFVFVPHSLTYSWVPYFLIFLGATTITYNLRNYIEIEKN